MLIEEHSGMLQDTLSGKHTRAAFTLGDLVRYGSNDQVTILRPEAVILRAELLASADAYTLL